MICSRRLAVTGGEGFQTEVHIDWEERRIRTDRTYVARILDNITSNIVKYANKMSR